MRIALLSYRSLPTCGGQGVYVRQVSRELVALGHEVTVISGPPYPILDDGVALQKLPSLDLWSEPNAFRWPAPRELRDLASMTEFVMMRTGQFSEPLAFSLRAYKALKPRKGTPPPFDIVHDNQTLGYGMVALRRALAPHGIPVVATLHHPITVDRRLHLEATKGIKNRFGVRRWYSFLPMQARVARQLDGIIIPSESSRTDINADMGLPSEQMHTVPLGTEHEVFSPDPSVAKVPGRIVVVTSADVPLKGLSVLLEALPKIRVERENAHVVCVGKARAGGAAARQVSELGLTDVVTFRSNLEQSELVDLLRSAEVAVVPSLYEGFSLPAVEEMSCGLPLVATTAGALPEVTGPDGEAALTVPPGDAGALAVAITRLLDDPELRARLGAGGRRRVEKRFSWKAATAGTAAWYAERIEAHRAATSKTPRTAGQNVTDRG
ncbi:glycosyltransferase family 4 protein [Frankia sp. CNm7]|uniref:Glycosyltransferase family 4 protein n=1 Tax=Frankia nepalensis TaxID=1836974 RepID=A0A937UT69_9ACTN|nr:glycosyltransferase family 4 protein [Frankia nepalensis]MBL7496732.1 glycosyltransferase family 4 protein [Frankia nepalensis]MBL7510446.1 glycosyltransferase family 4 protein [Frankia nepalensis]MBL7524838.1 glycosyltransferase family 4 protein [Frankia nepalensis]MBL7630960.1 glycosyltransferase family 4 protein [Frankia nepalensis]